MFRRKEEDSLFPADSAHTESATIITPPASGASSSPSTPSAAPAAAAPAAPRPEASRPAAPATGFRSTAAPLGDIGRNRMPETKSAMSGPISDKSKGGKRVLTVGNDILLKGEIATCDRLVIEGKVDATLNDVHTVEITESGSFKGAAQIEDAEISGLFEGELVVRNRLVIYSTGKVRGKITYGEIEIERGGELTGEIKTNSSASSSAARPSRQFKDEKATAAA